MAETRSELREDNEKDRSNPDLSHFLLHGFAEIPGGSKYIINGGEWDPEKRNYTIQIPGTTDIYKQYHVGKGKTVTGGGDPRVFEKFVRRDVGSNGKITEVDVVKKGDSWVKAGVLAKQASFMGVNNAWTYGHITEIPPQKPGELPQFTLSLKSWSPKLH
jgi:hypothetical protein